MGPAVLPAPVRASVTVPACDGARPKANTVEIVRVALPEPFAGDTWIHGWLGVAVHVIVPVPVCVMRTVCGYVTTVNDAPALTPANTSDVRSSAIVGPVPFCVIVKIWPPINRVTLRWLKFVYPATL